MHYDFSLWGKRFGSKDSNGNTIWEKSRGIILSPFLGVYDIEKGINGLAAGVVFGYWKGNGNFGERTSLNIGYGITVHRNQLVMGEGIKEGSVPQIGLVEDDYTTRSDVKGRVFMLSVSVGF